MRPPSTAPAHGPQDRPAHAAAVIALIQAKLAQIEKDVAGHLYQVDLLTGAHFYLTQSLRQIEQRADVATRAGPTLGGPQGDSKNE